AASDLSDADLLDRYRYGREEAAFALLVERHGPTVLGVCRRVLGNSADVDDAFQATFLVLLQKAGSVRRAESLGCWLYGVAWNVAAKARSRRGDHESMPERAGRLDPVEEAIYRDVVAVLDVEIGHLPEKYRTPLVLCGLGERSCEQAARELH